MKTTIFPAMRYEDAPAAIAWLCEAFGFEKHFVVPGPDDTIAHAQLKFGPCMIMLGSALDDQLDVKTPRALGGNTQSVYVYVEDIDAHHDRAVAAGAEIRRPLQDTQYGSREYTARDPGGHIWSFGTYQPEAH